MMTSASKIRTKLVNREKEVRLIAERLEVLSRNEPLLDPVLFFYGVPRVGKTRLLEECRLMASSRGMPTAFVDFDKEYTQRRYEDESGKTQLAFDLMQALVESADAPAGNPIFLEKDNSLVAAEKLQDYIRWLQGFLKKPIALLFDTLEESPGPTFSWLQDELLAPLLDTSRILVGMAGWAGYRESKAEFHWPIVRRMFSHHLRPFTEEETRQHLDSMDSSHRWSSHPRVFDFTGGLPGLNEEAVSTSANNITELLKHIVDVIFKRAGKKELQPLERDLLSALSVLRKFDTLLLMHITDSLWPDEYKNIDRPRAREILKSLRDTSFLEIHPNSYGYVIPHDLRRVLNAEQRERDTKRHFKVHCLAARWFREQVKEGDVVDVADELYHLAGAWKDTTEYRDMELTIPSDLFEGNNKKTQLTKRLKQALEIAKTQKRPDELREKIRIVLKSDEFHWVLDDSEIKNLAEQCDDFLGEAV